jgi:hypothetical protein
MEVSQLLGHPPVYFAPDNLIVELKFYSYGRCIFIFRDADRYRQPVG